MHITVDQVQGRVPIAILAIHGDLDASNYEQVIDKARELYGAGARHLLIDFSDMPFISPARYSNIEINAARAITITNAYVLAFFDRYLRGRRQPLLEGNVQKFTEVTSQVYRPSKASYN